MLTKDDFRCIIDNSRKKAGIDDTRFMDLITTQLLHLPDEDIVAFSEHFTQAFHLLNVPERKNYWYNDLKQWSADGYDYWLFWLVSLDNQLFNQLITDAYFNPGNKIVPLIPEAPIDAVIEIRFENKVYPLQNKYHIEGFENFGYAASSEWERRYGEDSYLTELPNYEDIVYRVESEWRKDL